MRRRNVCAPRLPAVRSRCWERELYQLQSCDAAQLPIQSSLNVEVQLGKFAGQEGGKRFQRAPPLNSQLIQLKVSTKLACEALIPPTAVGGCFRSFLQDDGRQRAESHPRQWVDVSDPFSPQTAGSSQISFTPSMALRSLALACRKDLKNPRTAVRGISKWSLALIRKDLKNPRTAVRGISKWSLALIRKDLKNPRTAVRGIPNWLAPLACRKDLKNPRTAVRGTSN